MKKINIFLVIALAFSLFVFVPQVFAAHNNDGQIKSFSPEINLEARPNVENRVEAQRISIPEKREKGTVDSFTVEERFRDGNQMENNIIQDNTIKEFDELTVRSLLEKKLKKQELNSKHKKTKKKLSLGEWLEKTEDNSNITTFDL
jgi:hypothetical protein